MRLPMQIDLLKELIERLDHHRPVDAGRIVANPTSSYICPDLAQKEWTSFFESHPQVLGLSCDLPRPGSFFTADDFGVPVLATRDQNGKFRAFVNACRHRGTPLTEDTRGDKKRFSCPFHAWTYASDGKLIGVPEAAHFGEIDKSCHGLRELPAEEKYGLLVVHPKVDGKL